MSFFTIFVYDGRMIAKQNNTVLTLTEYAARHQVTRNTIFNWMNRNKLPDDVAKIYQLPGGHWRVCIFDEEIQETTEAA